MEQMVDSEEKELLALIERKEDGQKDISKKIKKESETNKRTKRHDTVQNTLEEFNEGIKSIAIIKTRNKILSRAGGMKLETTKHRGQALLTHLQGFTKICSH